MRINSINKNSIDKIHILSGENKQTVRSFFESLVSTILINYMEGESTNIPFIGDISIQNEKDDEGFNHVYIKIVPDDNLLRNVDQIRLNQESDIEKNLQVRIREALRTYLTN